ncbi:integral membrane protein 2B-like [Myxocyprinus asiaticus]|uniref:integral membrane protein 2B-like n=1 Tax=Myxocyprinus asiaticus TaxID=70543 RepID=UPI00222228DB|nr:integral membrane protein 2B-like [Myxocyprinus asiaticus]
MVKVSFNTALAQKDPKKDSETLIPDAQDPEAAAFVHQQSKVWCWCFCLGLALVLSGVIVGGAYLYKYYVLEEERVFVCGMKYIEEDYDLDGEVEVGVPLKLIEENLCILEDDEVELITVPVPEFRDSDPANIVHDFNMRLTAYLDLNLNKCYIIALNTSIVMPPKDLLEFLVNIKAGTYLPQSYLVHEEMMVTEKLESTTQLGYFINNLCKDKDMYRLQRRDTILGIQKREALNCLKIRHFENKFVVETLICEP